MTHILERGSGEIRREIKERRRKGKMIRVGRRKEKGRREERRKGEREGKRIIINSPS